MSMYACACAQLHLCRVGLATVATATTNVSTTKLLCFLLPMQTHNKHRYVQGL